jgi:hypothetical protein
MKTTDKNHAKAKEFAVHGFLRQSLLSEMKKIRKAREKFQGLGLYFAPQKKRYLLRRLLRGSRWLYFL